MEKNEVFDDAIPKIIFLHLTCPPNLVKCLVLSISFIKLINCASKRIEALKMTFSFLLDFISCFEITSELGKKV